MRTWGTTRAEERLPWPCDGVLPDATHAYFRGVDVAAPAATTFRWLCQLRAAPYSYDWIDNLGRRSPRTLTPGLEELEVGQRVATIFRLASFEPGRSITIATSACAATYAALPAPGDPARSRLVAKLLLRAPGPAPVRAALGWAFGWGDLVMMRRQLLTLRDLSEAPAP